MQDWYLHQCGKARASENWPLAEWYLDRLIESAPEHWESWRDRAIVRVELGNEAGVETDRQHALSKEPDDVFLTKTARRCSVDGKWAEVLRIYHRVKDNTALSLDDRQIQAIAAVLVGDLKEYQQVCKAALDQIETQPPMIGEARITAFFCRFAVLEPLDSKRAIGLSQRIVAHWPATDRTSKGHEMETLGWLFLRAKDYEQAIEVFEDSDELQGQPSEMVNMGLAMAYGLSGDRETAASFAAELGRDEYRDSQAETHNRAIIDHMLKELDAVLAE